MKYQTDTIFVTLLPLQQKIPETFYQFLDKWKNNKKGTRKAFTLSRSGLLANMKQHLQFKMSLSTTYCKLSERMLLLSVLSCNRQQLVGWNWTEQKTLVLSCSVMIKVMNVIDIQQYSSTDIKVNCRNKQTHTTLIFDNTYFKWNAAVNINSIPNSIKEC